MSLFKTKGNNHVNERPSLLITLKLINKKGEPIDETEAWLILHEAFKSHPLYSVQSALISPDKSDD